MKNKTNRYLITDIYGRKKDFLFFFYQKTFLKYNMGKEIKAIKNIHDKLS